MNEVKRLQDFDELEVVAASLPTPDWFQTPGYLRVFARHFCRQKETILLAAFSGNKVLGYGAFERLADKVIFLGMKPVLGKEEVTDYGDIVGDWQAFLGWFKQQGVKSLQLDYVREDSATATLAGVREKKLVAPYLDLPSSWEEYLATLERKHRKELKRKIERLEETESFYECTEETLDTDFQEFVRLHRLSDPDKNKFMSQAMAKFFYELKTVRVSDWEAKLCFLKVEGKPVAAVMTLENENEVWLYNSGYDPQFSYLSVGLLLKAYKIKKAIEVGKKRYDFLRGSERYKYELGAQDRQLYQILVYD